MNPERFQQVDRILQSVLERPASEREVFLDRACGNDAVFKSEVRSLLASYDEAGSFIERPVATGRSSIFFYALSREGKRFAITRRNLNTSFVLISDFK